MQTYTVQSGDTLGTIAAKFLGDSQRWQEIAAANPQITNVNLIKVGEVVNIPAAQTTQVSKNVFSFPSWAPSAEASTLTSAATASGSFMDKIKELAQNKKLLIGVGLGLVAYLYVQNRRKKK